MSSTSGTATPSKVTPATVSKASTYQIVFAMVPTWGVGALVAAALLSGVRSSDPSGSPLTLIGVLGITIAVLVLAVSIPMAVIQTRTSDRSPLVEQLPRHLSAPTLVLPMTSTLSGAVLTLSVLLFTLTLGADPTVATTWRPHAVMFGFLAIAGGCISPIVAFRMIQDEYEGRDAPIFDSKARPERVEAAVVERWAELVGRRRLFLRRARQRALGNLTSSGALTWPQHWNGRRELRPRRVYLAMVAVISTTFGAASATSAFGPALETIVAALFAIAIATTVALSIIVTAHTRLQSEQGRADMLRRASSQALSAAETQQKTVPQAEDDPGPLVADATGWQLLMAVIKRARSKSPANEAGPRR